MNPRAANLLRLFFFALTAFVLGGCARPSTLPNNSPAPAATTPKAADVMNLFDGKTLAGWKLTDFGGGGEIGVEKETLRVGMGLGLSGVNWTNDFPRGNYEVTLEAMKLDGNDFFCGLTFPVGESFATLIVGGWGGAVTGISSVDHADASENETTKFLFYEKNRWYKIRLQVTEAKIQAWIDGDAVVDLALAGHMISLRPGEIESSKPFGLATWQTTAAWRNIQLRRLPPAR